MASIDGWTYGVAPAFAGYVIALFWMLRARRTALEGAAVAPDAEALGMVRVMHLIPLTAVIFAVVVAVLAGQGTMPLGAIAVVGAVGGLTCIAQAAVAAGATIAILRDPLRFGKALVLQVIPETFAIFALVLAVLSVDGVALPAWGYWAAGAGLGLSALLQTVIAASSDMDKAASDEGYPPFLMRFVVAEIPGILGFAAALYAFGATP